MGVLGLLSVTLEVPNIADGVAFYTDAGLAADVQGGRAALRCIGQNRPSLVMVESDHKRLHHITLRAEGLEDIANAVPAAGGTVIDAPAGFDPDGLWVADPHGMVISLVNRPPDPTTAALAPFEINAPGRLVRTRRSAMAGRANYGPVRPLRLGHTMLFSPDVPRSVAFMTKALGMGLADHAEDVVAFCCSRMNSDHHVVAFANSPGIGFHHVSFQVADPDEVGRGGRILADKATRGDWGFGRHTIGSNFFHYIQDPWGSWFEYYSDMDHIDDYSLWTPTNYSMEDSLANWGPPVPSDFVHNYETDALATVQNC